MRQISVQTASSEYEVVIGPGQLAQAGSLFAHTLGVCDNKALLVCDANTAPYAEKVADALAKEFIPASILTLPAGESCKNLATVSQIWERCARERLSRADYLVAVGGGVVGDLVGFAASTYLRGIGFVQVPTTLLAAVDASVGGKTGFDTAYGKNQIGSFYQPALVVIDTDALKTLPNRELACGFAEVIKYTCIAPKEVALDQATIGAFFDPATRKRAYDQLEDLIAACIKAKAAFVRADELDAGVRKILNFGHTIGHALEAATDFTGYSHGEAVGLGMLCALLIGAKLGVTRASSHEFERVSALLKAAQLPTSTTVDLGLCVDYLVSDKKRSGNLIEFILSGPKGPEIYAVDVKTLQDLCLTQLAPVFVGA